MIEPGGEMAVTPDRLREVDGPDRLVERFTGNRRRLVDVGRGRRPLLEYLPCGGIHRRGVAAVLLVQLEYVAAVQPCEFSPRRHIPIMLQQVCGPSAAAGGSANR